MGKEKKQKKTKNKKKEIKIREIRPEEFESELEEKIEREEENIDDNEFHEFLQFSSERLTPVLERNQTSQEPANLEQNVFSAPADTKKNEEIKYKTISEGYEAVTQESKRMQDEELIIHRTLPTRIESERINFNIQQQNFEINPELQEFRRRAEGKLEGDYVVKASGKLKETKAHSPIEQQEKKYEIK